MNSSHWKLIVAVVLLLGAAGVWWYYNAGQSGIPDSIRYVDIATGEFVWIRRSQTPSVLPGKNPRSGEHTLLPVTTGEDGHLYVSERHGRACLRDPEVAKLNKHVDPTTLELIDVQQ